MKKLHRSTTHRIWQGVLGGLGEYWNIDPNLIRLLFLILILATGIFPGVVAYVIAIFMIPEAPHANS